MCAGHASYSQCMYNATISDSRLATMQVDLNNWSGSLIDDTSHTASQRVFLFVGEGDHTVGPNPMIAVRTQYADNGVVPANLEFVRRAGAAHILPTDLDAPGNNACGSSASPFVANCGYDGARAVLTRLYGPLNPRNDAPPASNFREFDQQPFSNNPGLSTNGIVILFPQARVDSGQSPDGRQWNQNLEFWNVFVTTTLRMAAPGYCVLGNCP